MIVVNGKSFNGTGKELKKLVQEGRNQIEAFSVPHTPQSTPRWNL